MQTKPKTRFTFLCIALIVAMALTAHAEIHTDKETVGEALEELGVIAGEESAWEH